MRIKSFFTRNWYKIIYIVASIIYIILLKNLNKMLLSMHFNGSIPLLKFNNYIALKYFAVAVLLLMAGVIIIIKYVLDVKKGYRSFQDIVIDFFVSLLIFILLILIFINISVPILRAIFGLIATVMGVIYVVTQ